MVDFTSVPVMGMGAGGQPVSLLATSDGSTVASPNSSLPFAKVPTSKAAVYTVTSAPNGDVLALGSFTSAGGDITPTSWVKKNGTWSIGSSKVDSPVREQAITYDGDWKIATGTNIAASDYSFKKSTPAGGFSSGSVVENTTPGIPVDAVNKGSAGVVATSINRTGTWTKDTNGNMVHNPGELVMLKTCQLRTTYTFPGYAGAGQIQHIRGVVNGDYPPTTWFEDDLSLNDELDIEPGTEGYFGLNGHPLYTVSWKKV